MPKPICFFIMPFGTKKTHSDNKNFPAEINFDLLWDKAYKPALEKDYEPIRADQDLGALIIKEMIERLVIADLVVADVTIPNANVYYELGIRHAVKQYKSVMIAADGSRQLFDIQQMPQLRFPLLSGQINDAQAKVIIQKIQSSLSTFANGESPVFQSVTGYPGESGIDKASSFESFRTKLMTFQSDMEELKLYPDKDQKKKKLSDIRSKYTSLIENNYSIGIKVLDSIRDHIGWNESLEFIKSMPEEFQNKQYVKEQKYLALGKTGEHRKAIANLITLIDNYGESSERYGLIGGRYKKLYKETGDKSNLDNAIKYYRKGMETDLNDYFPSCNLPNLYMMRNKRGDRQKALQAATITRIACNRAKRLNAGDQWLRPTLLGNTFFEGDIRAAEQLLEEIKDENNIADWMKHTTSEDLASLIELHEDEELKESLREILTELKELN